MAQTKKQKEEKQEIIIPTSEFSLDLVDIIDQNLKYFRLTTDITENINRIFDNYLDIGNILNEIKDAGLFVVEEYKDIYDYALDKFDLAKTTVHNIMAISSRFTDDRGDLLLEYQGLNFSTLVELVSVDQLDLDNYKGLMTVKEVRTKKKELKINKLIDESLSEVGTVTQIIEKIKAYDIHTKLNLDARLHYEIDKEEFSEEDTYSYDFSVSFVIQNVFPDKSNIEFRLVISRHGYDLRMRTLGYYDIRLKNLDEVDTFMDYVCEKAAFRIKALNELNKSAATSSVEASDKSPSFHSFSTTNNWNLINPILNRVAKRIDSEVYYEWINNDNLAVYKEAKKNKKKNPVLFYIKYPNDLNKIQLLNADETPFDEFNSVNEKRAELIDEIFDVLLDQVLSKTDCDFLVPERGYEDDSYLEV